LSETPIPYRRSLTDWALLFALVAMWGSSYMFNKIGIATVPPATLVFARLALGALLLLAVMYARGLRLPPPGRIWWYYLVLAVVGNCLPYYGITTAQLVIDSALTGILVAAMPLATLVLAHFFVAGEALTRNRLVGFVLGFAGIVALMGPAALADLGGSSRELFSQLLILMAALCYAANAVFARRVKLGDVLVASAAMLLLAAVIALPVALVVDRPWALEPSASSTAAVIWLGIGPTAIAALCYLRLIATAGPSFMSLVNYLAPLISVALGLLLMNEAPGLMSYFALVLILGGIAWSQRRG